MPGDTVAEVVDTSRAIVDVAIDEDDVLPLHPGEKASMKLEGFPTRTFHGEVAVVSPRAKWRDGPRLLRPGRVPIRWRDPGRHAGPGQSCHRMESGRKSNLPPSRNLDLVEAMVMVRMVSPDGPLSAGVRRLSVGHPAR